jgi:hypothetical protein
LIIGEVPDLVPFSKPTQGLIVEQPSDIMRGRGGSASKKSKSRRGASKKSKRITSVPLD